MPAPPAWVALDVEELEPDAKARGVRLEAVRAVVDVDVQPAVLEAMHAHGPPEAISNSGDSNVRQEIASPI